jgi:hypothetical protein
MAYLVSVVMSRNTDSPRSWMVQWQPAGEALIHLRWFYFAARRCTVSTAAENWFWVNRRNPVGMASMLGLPRELIILCDCLTPAGALFRV